MRLIAKAVKDTAMIALGLVFKPQAGDGVQFLEHLMGECDARDVKPRIVDKEVALPNQQRLRLVDNLTLPDRIQMNLKNKGRSGDIFVEYPPKASGNYAKIMNKKDTLLYQHAGKQLKGAHILLQERAELLVVGLRPARELNLVIEFLMTDERADDTSGYAEPRIRHIMAEQHVRYMHYRLLDRGASHFAPGPQDMMQIPAERLAYPPSEWRYAEEQDLREGYAASLFEPFDKFLVYSAFGEPHASGEQCALVSPYVSCNRRSGTPQAKNILLSPRVAHVPWLVTPRPGEKLRR